MSALFSLLSLLYKQCTNPNFGSPDAERTTLLFGFAVFGQLCGSFIGTTVGFNHSEVTLSYTVVAVLKSDPRFNKKYRHYIIM